MKKAHMWAAKLVAIVMLVTAFAGISVFADTPVAAEGDLVQAVADAADGAETVIQLGGDITLTNTLSVPAGKNIVLDLNGHTLTVASDIDVIDNSGTLTVKNGTVAALDKGSGTQGMAVDNLDGATLTVTQDESFATKLIGRSGIQNAGTAVVENGTVESYNRNAIYTDTGSETVINGGTVTSPSGSSGMGRAISANGNVTITGGTIYAGGTSGAGDAYVNAIGMYGQGKLVIRPAENSTVTVTSETDYAVANSNSGSTVEIYGGTFACNGSRAEVMNFGSTGFSVYGGTFKHDVNKEYIPEGYVSVLQSDGTYSVMQAGATAEVSVSTYEELAAALQNVSVLEPKNITVSASFEIPQSADLTLPTGFTLNVPANVTLTVSGIVRAEGTVVNSGTLTVSSTGFIEYPLNVTNNGTITDYPVVENGVCSISTPMQLQWLSHLVENSNDAIPSLICLTGDITLPDVKFTPIGNTRFYCESTFDGQNHTIGNLNIEVTSEYRGGLFGNIGDVVIRNLTINGTSTNSTSSYIGALAGYASGTCSIENVHVSNYMVSSPISYGVGGFIGQIWTQDSADRVDFINCSLENTNIKGFANVGAFWGTSTGSVGTIGIYNCAISGSASAINVNCGICGGYGASAPVQVIGLDNTLFDATSKGAPVTSLVAYTETTPDTAHADAAQYQAVKDASGNWVELSASETPEAYIGSVPYATLEDALADASNGETVTLMVNAEIDQMLDIKNDGVTLDFNRHSITASEQFTYNEANPNSCHLVQVTGDNVTVKNGTLTATDGNKNTLNVYHAQGIVLQDLTIDHTNGVTGAPLVVAGSDVTLAGNVKFITGENSWYGMNIDSREISGAAVSSSVTVAEGAALNFTGESKLGIYLENAQSAANADVSIEFEPNVTVTSPVDGFVAISTVGEDGTLADVAVIHPENAGLEMSDDGTSVPHQHTTELRNAKEATCTKEGYTGDLVCTTCGAVVEQGKTIARIPHNFVDGKCTMCGTIDTGFRPEIIEGANSVWTSGSTTGLTIVSNAAFADFLSVSVDGNELDASLYTAESGSTRITLSAQYLATLSTGSHTIAIASQTGIASTTFTIQAASSGSSDSSGTPVASVQTGDSQTPFVWVALLAVSAVCICAVAVYAMRKKNGKAG